MQIALQVPQVRAVRASYSVSALSSQVHSAQVHRFTVSMFSCFPSGRLNPALHLSLPTLVDLLLCNLPEVLQRRFVYINYGGMFVDCCGSSVFDEAVYTRSLLAYRGDLEIKLLWRVFYICFAAGGCALC